MHLTGNVETKVNSKLNPRWLKYIGIILIVSFIAIFGLLYSSEGKINFLVRSTFGLWLLFAILLCIYDALRIKRLRGYMSPYGKVEPTHFNQKPVQYILGIILYTAIAIGAILLTKYWYLEFLNA